MTCGIQSSSKVTGKYFHSMSVPQARHALKGEGTTSPQHTRASGTLHLAHPRQQLPLQTQRALSRQQRQRAHLSDSTRQILLCGHIIWSHQPTVKEEVHTGVDVKRV